MRPFLRSPGLIRQLQVLFFVSGFSALVLEVVSVKLLGYWTGNTASAVGAVLSAYMAGLAAGSFAAGKWLTRWKRPIVVYGALELGIGVYALSVPWIMERFQPAYLAVTFRLGPDTFLASFCHFVGAVALLLGPTLLMGASFPVVVRAGSEGLSDQPLVAERLYAVNLAGAALGTLLSDFVFIRFWGLGKALVLVAALNGVVAMSALVLGRSRGQLAVECGPGAQDEFGRHSPGGMLLPVAFAGGFLVLFLEVVWTHMAGEFLTNTAYGFAVTLFMVIAGLGVGAALVCQYRASVSAHDLLSWVAMAAGILVVLLVPLWDNARTLAWKYPLWSVYAAIALAGAGAVVLAPRPKTLIYVLLVFPGLALVAFIYLRLARLGALFLISHGVVLGVAALFMLGPAILMGMIFPLVLDRQLTASAGRAGSAVAQVYAVNTLGAIAGIVLATFFVLPRWGVEWGGRWAGLGFFLLGLLLLKRPRKRKWTVALPVVPVLAWVLLAPPWDFSKNHSAFNHQGRMIYAREDLNGGVTTVLDSGAGRNLYSNALFQAGTGLVAEDQARFALMPLLHVQGFERALVIGVGSGQTAGVLGQFPFRSLDLVDYSPGILEAAQRFFPQSNFGIFNDPRVKVHVADGRHYLLTHAEKLDLLTLEVTRLWVAGEGDLYTRQFYEICAARLRDQGVLQQWVPLFSLTVPDALILLRTVREVFPHVALYIGVESGFLVASRSPLTVEVTRLQEIESEPRLRMLLHSLGLSRAANLLGDCALVPESLDRLLAETEDRRVSTDLWPHLEYSTAYYSVGNPTTGQMRRFFLRDREFQLPSIRGADVAELAEIQREALEERIRQIPVPK